MSYTTKSGDTWDGIAKTEVYKFDSGVVLATPEVEVKAKTDESLPPWKR